jgi:hypothetical protein
MERKNDDRILASRRLYPTLVEERPVRFLFWRIHKTEKNNGEGKTADNSTGKRKIK